jgi:lysophospholipase L1-like esterase
MRESGMVFDKLVLTSDAAYVPSGTGPAESLPTESLPTVLDESFSSDTLVNYSIIPTNTQGGIGQVLYDPDWQCLQFITGSNVGIELVRNVGTLSSGQFSLEFWPSVSYSPGGTFSFRLKQDANNYYEVKNSDVGGTGIFRKVVAGVVVDAVVIQDEYIQDKNYHLLINFSPQSTKVLAFGKFYTLDTNSADIAVKTLEIEFAGQDGYIDNIRYAAELNDYYVAMGDSITLASFHDDISSDGIGYQPILATRLAEDKDYPHTVVNKGVSGEDSAAGLLRLPNLLQAYPLSRFFLIQYGTNDVLYGLVPSGLGLEPGDTGYPGSFKDNMQQIIDQIKAADKIPMLAKVPKAFGTRDYLNPTLQVFNAVIDELVNENYIGVTPPNFYCHFENNPDEMDDTLHPNGTGFISMANIWYEVLTDSYGGCSP